MATRELDYPKVERQFKTIDTSIGDLAPGDKAYFFGTLCQLNIVCDNHCVAEFLEGEQVGHEFRPHKNIRVLKVVK